MEKVIVTMLLLWFSLLSLQRASSKIESWVVLHLASKNHHLFKIQKSYWLLFHVQEYPEHVLLRDVVTGLRWRSIWTTFQNSSEKRISRMDFFPPLCLFVVMDNYKNTPQYLYGLSPSQVDMFMTEDNPVRRQADRVTEESISSSCNYLNNGGMWSKSGMDERGPSKYSMSVSMYRGGARGYGRPRTAPPGLPSLLLDARIVYLGMPIVPAVTELLVAQFMWLDYENPSKSIYLYINSSGTQNEKMKTVGSETEAYAIADTMAYCKSDVYTVNCGMAYGQAAMLLSLGAKGYRAVQPNCSRM